MKKTILAFLSVVLISNSARAWEFPGFEWGVGADITSAYLWRGINLGGLAIQPDVSIGYGGLNLEAWANISPENYTFKTFAPELDLTLSYSIYGFKVGVTHQYYFDDTKFFDYSTPSVAQIEEEDYAGNQTEVFAEFHLGDILEDYNLNIGWYTYVAGDDWLVENGKVKRAWSSYLEVSYDIPLPLNFTLTPTVGCTPWKSMYNYYEADGFSVNNISLKLNWELEFGDHGCMDVYGIAMLNTAGLNKDNVWTATANSYERRLNLGIGVGFWLY